MRGDRAIVTHVDPKNLRDWREAIGWSARIAISDAAASPIEGAVAVRATFRVPRPQSVSRKKRPHPIVKPDLDKLTRALLDALSGICFRDDAQVVRLEIEECYALKNEQPGVSVEVSEVS